MTKSKGAKSFKPQVTKKAPPKREVQVVSCPSAFPISDPSKRKRPRATFADNNNNNNKQPSRKNNNKQSSNGLLDWHETAKEIRSYGATAFSGKQKRDYEDEQYFQLTGRHKKKQKVPLPIVRGIKKAAAKKEARAREEARAAGIVLPTQKQEKKKASSTYQNYGPAPSVGFMKNGVLRVSKKR